MTETGTSRAEAEAMLLAAIGGVPLAAPPRQKWPSLSPSSSQTLPPT